MAAAIGATAVWGLGNLAVAEAPLGGIALAFHRLWLGALVYGGWLAARGRFRFTAAQVRAAVPGALAFSFDIATFFEATRHTTLADAVTIGALQPVVILAVAGRRFGERIRTHHVVCTAIAVTGVAMVVRGSSSTGRVTLYGELMAVAGLFAWSWYFVASKEARQHLGTVEYLTLVFLIGTPVMGVWGLLSGQLTDAAQPFGWEPLLWALAVVLLPGTGHLLVNWAHHHTTITFASLATLFMPVISAVGAAIWIDQPVGPLQGIGIAVVILALIPVIVRERS